MELIIEFILELIFECGEEICKNKKISKWIRYPILFLIGLITGTILVGIIFLGVSLLKTNILVGLISIGIALVLLIGVIYKFRKVYLKKEGEKNESIHS